MKTHSLVRIEPEGLRPDDAAQFVGISTRQLEKCAAALWIKPAVRTNRMTIYRPAALRLLLNRIEAEGLPPESETPTQHPA